MNITKLLFLSIISFFILSTYSCQKKNRMANHEIINSIDDYTGWVMNKDIIVKGEANSGTKYVSLGEKSAYGPRYKIHADELLSLRKVNVEFSVRTYEENTKALYVFQILRGDSNICWKSYDIRAKKIQPNEWTQVEKIFDFSKFKLEPNDLISIYPWSPDNIKVDFDDIKIEFK